MDDPFVIDKDAMPRFPTGSVVDDVDRRGNPIKGRVKEVKQGNNVALVYIEPAPAASGK
jgi:hypothetical protein